MERIPFDSRLHNAVASYGLYFGKTLWPMGLSVFYPYWEIGLWKAGAFAFVLAGVTLACIRQRRARPCLLVGWCWFVVMLLPVIGVLQVGSQAMADRYTYLPLIGLFVAVAWGAGKLRMRSSASQASLVLAVLVILTACVATTRLQLARWQNTLTLFTHALEVTPRNVVAHHALGAALEAQGRLDEARQQYLAALELAPAYDTVQVSLGGILARQGRGQEAKDHFLAVLETNPRHARARRWLGNVLFAEGRFAEATVEYERAWQLEPNAALTVESLAALAYTAELPATAVPHLQRILELLPTAEAREELAAAWARQGHGRLALQTHRAALSKLPDSPEILNNLAWLLATCPEAGVRDGAEAVRLAERACALTQSQRPFMVGTLAAAYAEAGRLPEAVATAEKAAALATAAGDEALARRNRELREQYRAGKPYREPAQP